MVAPAVFSPPLSCLLRPSQHLQMKLPKDWLRMNKLPEWRTADPDAQYTVKSNKR